MELADIFEKLANNARLTPHEMDFLKNSMRQTQMSNSFVAGTQNGQSSINVSNINAKKILLGEQSSSGVFVKLGGSEENVASSVASNITNWTPRNGDTLNNFYISGEYIYTPLQGMYKISAVATFEANATGYRRLTISWDGENASHHFYIASSGAVVPTTVYGEVNAAFVAGRINVFGAQNSGSALDIGISVYIEKTGEYKQLPT